MKYLYQLVVAALAGATLFSCKGEEKKAISMICQMYQFFVDHPDELPNEFISIAWQEGTPRAACDYIAGMTDGFALKTFSDYFIPSGWTK